MSNNNNNNKNKAQWKRKKSKSKSKECKPMKRVALAVCSMLAAIAECHIART